MPLILYEYRDNEYLKIVWPCVISLQKIVEIVHSYQVNDDILRVLQSEVSKHLSYVKDIFNTHLRPKHHSMLHYATTMRKMGPIIYLSMMRFEAKHQQIKRLLGAILSFRNINKSLAIKHQRSIIQTQFIYKDDIETARIERVNSLTPNNQLLLDMDDLHQTKWVRINSYEYMLGLFFIHNWLIYEIDEIFVIKNKFILVGEPYIIKEYNEIINGFEIQEKENTTNISVFVNELSNEKTYEKKTINQKTYLIGVTIDLNKLDVWG